MTDESPPISLPQKERELATGNAIHVDGRAAAARRATMTRFTGRPCVTTPPIVTNAAVSVRKHARPARRDERSSSYEFVSVRLASGRSW